MRIKHRIPSIFNLSMVDVLCCALGCVILLWLLNLRAAKQSAVAAGKSGAELTEARKLLDQSRKSAEALSSELDAARARQADLDRMLARLRDEHAAALKQAADLDRTLGGLRAENAAVRARLAKKTQEQNDLAKEMAETRKRLATLDTLIRDKERLLADSTHRADDLDTRLADADARAKKLQLLADQIPGLKDEAARSRSKLDAAEARARSLEKDIAAGKRDLSGVSGRLADLESAKRRLERDLGDANRGLERLQTEKRRLTDDLARARASADNRFAGISLTGRRVVFLVDMSGSMELVDEQTPAPEKWTGVRETLAKIMKSLPELEKFQVILFSERTTYLLGGTGDWLTYDPRTSADQVTRALAVVSPTGNTNMSAAFEAAFRYRDQGLDTIYVLSDGLPNIGAGLEAYGGRDLKETERAEILGSYVRKKLKTDWNRSVVGRPRVRINAVGFFYESPDVGAFLWALARENEGSFVGMSKP